MPLTRLLVVCSTASTIAGLKLLRNYIVFAADATRTVLWAMPAGVWAADPVIRPIIIKLRATRPARKSYIKLFEIKTLRRYSATSGQGPCVAP